MASKRKDRIVRVDFKASPMSKNKLIGTEKEANISVTFIDNVKYSHLDDNDLIYYYEESWSFANLFEFVHIQSVYINNEESTIDKLKEFLNFSNNNYLGDMFLFNPIAKFYIIKDVN